jgi:hypothetical protein
MTHEQAISLQEILLDATALDSATGGRGGIFSPRKVADPVLLGVSRYRRAKLLASDDAQLDWHFQILVQAWSAQRGFTALRDLQDDSRFSGKRSCDFALSRANGRTELLECTRVHPASSQGSTNLQALITKIADRLPDKISQLRSSACVIGVPNCNQHLLIDISAYARTVKSKMYGAVEVEVTGLQKSELATIAAALNPYCEGLAQVTLCWHELVRLNGMYRAIIQQTRTLLDKQPDTEVLRYAGWTVEGYPMSKAEYREFRVSTTARSLDWIVTSYNNLSSPETFYTTSFQKLVK